MEPMLDEVRLRVREKLPSMEAVFDDYAGEARFALSLLDAEIASLPKDAHIMEIGAGMLLLSCFLQRSGYQVTAIEPTGEGFSHFDALCQTVLDYASEGGFTPDLRIIPAEQLDYSAEFDFAFSINVMEHVGNVSLVLHQVLIALKPGCGYRFLCPNYLFPYEPHFNMPTLFSKSLTERVFGRWIFTSSKVLDPVGTWASLNWISVASVRRICVNECGVVPDFDGQIFYRFVMRALNDQVFQRRRGFLINAILALLENLGATKLLKWLPAIMQPAMYCLIIRN